MADDDRQAEREARRRARMEQMQDEGEGQSADSNADLAVQGLEDESNSGRNPDERQVKENAEDDRKRRDEERRKEEIAQERQMKLKDKEQKERKEKEDAAKKKKPGAKKKGLGGLSPEKKRLLKTLIMQKAAEEMKAEARRRQEEKENKLKTLVGSLDIENVDQAACNVICKKLYASIVKLEGEKYDWEVKIRHQDFEINELTTKVNDIKGKFVKPVLKKVNKTESKLARLGKNENKQSLSAFRGQLKSTGQNKFALEEKEEGHQGKPDWREHLKNAKEGGEGGEDGEEVAAANLEAAVEA